MSPRLATGIRRASAPILFLGCALLLTLILARSFLIHSDEGYTLNAAWQLWNGMRMYDDFRLFVGPGSGYAVFWVWKLSGSPSDLAARLLAVGFSFSSTVAFYLVLRRLGIRGLNLAFTVVGWLLASAFYVPLNHNSFSSYAAVWFLLLFLRVVGGGAARQARTRDHLLVGAAAGLVFVFLPMKGALLAFSAAAFLFAVGRESRAFRPVLGLGAGFIALVAPLFVYWSPATLVRQWVLIPLAGNYLGHTSASGRYLVAAIVLVAGMGFIAVRRRDPVLKALTVVQAALFLGMTHNMEGRHFAINAFPVLLFASLAVDARFRGAPDEPRFPSELALGMVTAVLVVWTTCTAAGTQFLADSTLHVDLLGHRPKVGLNWQTSQAHAIYAGPFLPGVYYLLRKKNPFFVSETVVCNDECQRRLVAQLVEVKPELAFLDYEMVAHLAYPQTGPVDVYLRDHYVACPGHGGIPVRAIAPAWCP
jgi:hypothetical protein